MATSNRKVNAFLALFATFLVVGGVALVAYVAYQAGPAPTAPSETKEEERKKNSTAPLLIIDRTGARIKAGEDERKLAWPTDTKLLGQPLSSLVGRNIYTGQRVYVDPDFKVVTSTGFRSPDGRRTLLDTRYRADGIGAVEVRYGDDSQTVVLRLPNGSPIRSAISVGWWDDETFAVTGMVTSTRALYAVSLSGRVEQVALLPDLFDFIHLDHGRAWYVAVQAGPGLEAAPMPPATLHRVTRNGTDEVVAEEPDHLIGPNVAGEDGIVAYAFALPASEAFFSKILFPGERTRAAAGVPFFVLRDKTVLFVSTPPFADEYREAKDWQNGALFTLGASGSSTVMLGNPSPDVSVFPLPKADIDEIFENQ